MGIVRLQSGIYAARKKVPERLAEAVAIVTDSPKSKVSWLKRSLGTRDQKQANILGKAVLMEFDRILAKAEAQLKTTPAPQEIKRIADYYYASKLAADDEVGLFTGARLGELGPLAVNDVVTDEATGITYLQITEDEAKGRTLKTVSSRRVIPVHSLLVKLGFLSKLVERRRSKDGESAVLFPLVTLVQR